VRNPEAGLVQGFWLRVTHEFEVMILTRVIDSEDFTDGSRIHF
jgi:hypothetical protein